MKLIGVLQLVLTILGEPIHLDKSSINSIYYLHDNDASIMTNSSQLNRKLSHIDDHFQAKVDFEPQVNKTQFKKYVVDYMKQGRKLHINGLDDPNDPNIKFQNTFENMKNIQNTDWADKDIRLNDYIWTADKNIQKIKGCKCQTGDIFCICPEVAPTIVMPIIQPVLKDYNYYDLPKGYQLTQNNTIDTFDQNYQNNQKMNELKYVKIKGENKDLKDQQSEDKIDLINKVKSQKKSQQDNQEQIKEQQNDRYYFEDPSEKFEKFVINNNDDDSGVNSIDEQPFTIHVKKERKNLDPVLQQVESEEVRFKQKSNQKAKKVQSKYLSVEYKKKIRNSEINKNQDQNLNKVENITGNYQFDNILASRVNITWSNSTLESIAVYPKNKKDQIQVQNDTQKLIKDFEKKEIMISKNLQDQIKNVVFERQNFEDQKKNQTIQDLYDKNKELNQNLKKQIKEQQRILGKNNQIDTNKKKNSLHFQRFQQDTQSIAKNIEKFDKINTYLEKEENDLKNQINKELKHQQQMEINIGLDKYINKKNIDNQLRFKRLDNRMHRGFDQKQQSIDEILNNEMKKIQKTHRTKVLRRRRR